jgi:hypothetical protein
MAKKAVFELSVETDGAVKEIDGVKHSLDGVAESTDNVAQQGLKMRDALQIGQGIVGGIAAFKGATALLGVENEKLLKTLTQLLAAQQLLEGSTRILNVLESQNVVLLKAKTIAMGIYNAIAKSAVATTALLTGGLTLLIGGIGVLISNLNDNRKAKEELTKATNNQKDAVRDLNKEVEDYNITLRDNSDLIERNSFIMGEGFVKSTDEGTAAIERHLKVLKASGASAETIYQRELDLIDAKIKALDDEMLTSENQIIQMRKIADLEADRDVLRFNLQKQRREKEAKAEADFQTLKRENEKNIFELKTLDELRADEREIERNGLRLEREKTAQQLLFEMTSENSRKMLDEQIANEEKLRAERQKTIQMTLANATQLMSAIGNLQEARLNNELAQANGNEVKMEAIRKQAFERNKKMQLGMAIIDGAKAITSILAQYPKFDGGIAMAAAIAASVITTASQIAVIKSAQYQGGAIGAATVTRSVDNFGNIVGQEGAAANTGSTEIGNQAPETSSATKVYIVDQEMQDALMRRDFVTRVSTIG